MAVKINFDSTHNAIEPTMVLAKKNGKLLGVIQASKIRFKDILNSPSEFSFTVYKTDYLNNLTLWGNIDDFKIIWVKEWNRCYEIYVETTDENGIHKSITAKSLGEAELSQINLYGIEINTENDIARENYIPTVLYSTENTAASLLHRISGKIPHYSFVHVDNSIKNIQRTFSFDGKSIYDCFQEIAEEIHCLFDIQCKYENSILTRTINVYDLDTYCPSCGERGSFVTICSKCGNTVGLIQGYGNDTGIFIDTENLADTITYKTDNESIKNCFKLEAGDDLMTATVISNNPNGSSYIWYIPPKTKQDMSAELVAKLEDYDELYDYYLNEYESTISQSKITAYNQLVTKYQTYSQDYQTITYPIVGFSKIIEADYNTIDLYLFLKNGLMPAVAVASTNANTEIAKLTVENLSPVAVQNLSVCSAASAESAVLSVAKTIIDNRYKIDITTSSFTNNTWSGTFTLTNYSDDEDTATSSSISITINDNYEKFVKQKIDKVISKTVADGEPTDIVSLFNLSNDSFETEIKKYCLTRLQSFHDCCQSCLDVLIQQGVADKTLWNNQVSDLYTTIYLPYYTKLGLLESEIQLRENEIKAIIGDYYSDGRLKASGLQTLIEKERTKIQKALNFEDYLGQTLWLEFATFRREDTYKNDNYISDGLNNAELFEKALKFIDTAKKDIVKSATLQHTITATLKNLLVMPEFSPLLNQFEVGNWLRAKVDGSIYKLRLIDYEIDYDDLNSLNVTFSDVVYGQDEVSDVESIISQAKSISTSYGAVTRQMEQGKKTTSIIDGWVENGLNVTNTKIVCQADNQTYTSDEHGMLFRKHDPVNNVYDDKQLKLTNSTLAITNDNWETVKSAVGFYYYFDPLTNKLTEGYGVIADTIIGKLVLGEQLGIYNSTGSLTFNHNGFNITNSKNTFNVNPNATNLLTISKTVNNTTESIFYVDNNGTLHIKGDGSALDITANSSITGLSSSLQATAEQIYATVSQAQSKYNTSGYTISLYGYGNPTSTAYPPADHNNEYYLNQSNGTLWLCNSRAWNQVTTLTLITDALSSEIQQTATSITSTVSTTYETKADATSKLNTAKGYTDTEVAEAKNYADSGISTARTALESQITQTADSITSTVASSQSKYNTSGYTISLYGYGNPTSTAYPPADHNNEYYLNQSNGTLWLCNSRAWNQVTTLTLITTNLQTQITQNDNNISLIANKNGSGTVLSLKSDAVKLAWNNVSENIQFETMNSRAGMSVYDDSSNLLMRFDSRGANYYLGTETIDSTTSARRLGYIGTGAFTNDSDMRGIVFRLNYVSNNNPTEGRYMSWGYQETDGGNYDLKMVYYANNYNTYAKGMHFVSDNVYFHTDTYFKDDMHLTTGCSLYINDYIRTYRMSDGTGGLYSSSKTVKIYSGDGVRLGYVTGTDNLSLQKYIDITSSGVDCHSKITMYGNIDMQNSYSVINESDERLKTNIKNTSVNALKTINQIELKEFDWIENNQHEKIGIIAQQLQTILPDLVFEDEGNTKLSIKLLKFIPYLIKAIQELSLEIGITNNSESKEYTNTISLKEKKKFLKTIRNQEDKNIETLETNSIKKERKRIEVKG